MGKTRTAEERGCQSLHQLWKESIGRNRDRNSHSWIGFIITNEEARKRTSVSFSSSEHTTDCSCCKIFKSQKYPTTSLLLPPNPFHWISLNHYPKTCAKEITIFLEVGKTAKQFLCFHYEASGGAVGGVVQGEALNVPAFSCKQQELQVIQCCLCTKCSLCTFSIVNDKNCPFFRFQNIES